MFLWAAHLAEQAGESHRAVGLYAQARKQGGPTAAMAALHLGRLHIKRGQYQSAIDLLQTHLQNHPTDTVARALLRLAEQSMP